jgi:hypothetical protein
VEKRQKYNRIIVVIAFLLVALGILIYFAHNLLEHIKYTSGKIDMTSEEAYETMETAQQILIKGDLDDWTQKPSIWVDNHYLGNLVEKGIINWQIKLLAGKEEMFHIQFDDTDLDEGITANTYGYFDSDDQVIGYAEETLEPFEDGTKDYVYLFYNQYKNKKTYYYYEKDGWNIYNSNGNLIVQGNYDYKVFTSEYEITITSYNKSVDLKDKMLIYVRVASYLQDYYDQR